MTVKTALRTTSNKYSLNNRQKLAVAVGAIAIIGKRDYHAIHSTQSGASATS
ncbi:hypothetical protein [Nostoc sp. C110]|uniref:hypothetical protein n=1 Tax=Nostoc sp. C110 TaxID=3349876 RepID=UPI00370D7D40